MNKKIIGLFFIIPICLVIGAVGGLYLGSIVFVTMANSPLEPSFTLIYKMYQLKDKIPAAYQMPMNISFAVTALVTVAPSIMILAATFMKPKRLLHGDGRFANPMEVQKQDLLKTKFKDPDILIGKYKGKFLRWAGNEFAFVAAPTRSGKGVGIVVPNCLHYRDSMVVFDPKHENFILTAGFRAKYGQKVFLFNPAGILKKLDHETTQTALRTVSGKLVRSEQGQESPLVSHRWNPLTYISRDPRFTFKDALNIANILYAKSASSSDSSTFFSESAQKLFTGLLMYMVETEHERSNDPKGKTTLANLLRLTSPSDGRNLQEWIKEEIEMRSMQEETALSDQCRTLLHGFANGNAKTGSDILATLTAPLTIFLDPVVEAATSADDFYLTDLRKQRMTIYLGIAPNETGTFSRLTNLFFSQVVNETVKQGLPENIPEAKYQCLLMMDEFTALGQVPIIESGVAYVAGYGLRFLLIFQSPSQVTRLYTKEGTRTFFTNFAVQIVYPPRDQDDAEEYSKLIGYETFKARSTSRSQGKGGSRSHSDSDQRRAVMLPDEMKIMPREDCVISKGSSRPIYAQKIIYYNDPYFMGKHGLVLPEVPYLDVGVHKTVKVAVPVAEKIKPEDLAYTEIGDTCNAQDLFDSVMACLIRPDSSQEYIDALNKQASINHEFDTMPTIKKLLLQAA
jgi:type IV secretion system protein VirD4